VRFKGILTCLLVFDALCFSASDAAVGVINERMNEYCEWRCAGHWWQLCCQSLKPTDFFFTEGTDVLSSVH